jgi:hypothetical protein
MAKAAIDKRKMRAKNDYQEKIETGIKRMHSRIYRLKIKAQTVNWEDEIYYLKEIGKLRIKKYLVEKRLRELKESKGDEWKNIKDSLDQEFDQLKKSVDDAVSTLK